MKESVKISRYETYFSYYFEKNGTTRFDHYTMCIKVFIFNIENDITVFWTI